MEILTQTLKSLTIGTPRTHGGLTMFPLVRPPDPTNGRGYLTLDEAVQAGTARVSEVVTGARVPELCLVNDGDRPVLLLDGEELVGAKQNRVLNLTILAPPKQTLIIPVSCVEAGRWSSVSEHFATSKQVMSSTARGRKSSDVTSSLRGSGRATTDQRRVWAEVAALSARHGVVSDTSRMTEVYEARSFDLGGYERPFAPVEGQVGAVFAIGGRLQGLELFADAEALRRLLPKLVRSWALDALPVASQSAEVPTADAVRAFLDAIDRAETTRYPAVGLGYDLRIEAPGLAGGALIHDDGVLHLCVFRTDEERACGDGGEPGGGSGGRMERASSRRSRRFGG